jgi:hypothetical protein
MPLSLINTPRGSCGLIETQPKSNSLMESCQLEWKLCGSICLGNTCALPKAASIMPGKGLEYSRVTSPASVSHLNPWLAQTQQGQPQLDSNISVYGSTINLALSLLALVWGPRSALASGTRGTIDLLNYHPYGRRLCPTPYGHSDFSVAGWSTKLGRVPVDTKWPQSPHCVAATSIILSFTTLIFIPSLLLWSL